MPSRNLSCLKYHIDKIFFSLFFESRCLLLTLIFFISIQWICISRAYTYFNVSIINALSLDCDNMSSKVYVSFFSWLATDNIWPKWLSVTSNGQLIYWMCWLDLVRNIYGLLITLQVIMRAKERMTKSPKFLIVDFLLLIYLVTTNASLMLGWSFWASGTLFQVSSHYLPLELMLYWEQNVSFVWCKLPCLPDYFVSPIHIALSSFLNFLHPVQILMVYLCNYLYVAHGKE